MSIVLVTLFIASLVFLFTFLFVLNTLYSKENKKMIDMKNTFIYESSSLVTVKGFLFISLALVLAGLITFTTKYFSEPYGSITIFLLVFNAIFLFCVGALPFVSFRTLKEHLYLDIGGVVSLVAIFGLEAYYCFDIYKLYDYNNGYALAGFIVSLFLLVLVLSFILNPRLFDLKMEVREETVIRKKFILLAFLEWSMLVNGVLSSIPLILLSNAF